MIVRSAARVILSFGLVIGIATSASAQATRTWVSGVGDDVNPCSRTAPCKTWAGAISKTAAGGIINALDPAGYGAVTITKNITLDGGGGQVTSSLSSLVNGVIINGASLKVTLRNFNIDSPTNANAGLDGVRVLATCTNCEVHIENMYITGFSGQGIEWLATTGELYVTNTTLTNNIGGGIHFTGGRAVVDRLRAEANDNGMLVLGTGIATVRNSYAGGGTTGFGTVPAGAVMNIENSTVTHNTHGIFASNGSSIRVSDTFIVNNVTNGIFNDGVSFVVSLSGNELVGNPNPGAFTATLPKQ